MTTSINHIHVLIPPKMAQRPPQGSLKGHPHLALLESTVHCQDAKLRSSGVVVVVFRHQSDMRACLKKSPRPAFDATSRCMIAIVAYIYICICICICLYFYIYICVCTCSYIYIYTHICIHTHTYIHIYIYIGVCVSIYIYIHTHVYSGMQICLYMKLHTRMCAFFLSGLGLQLGLGGQGEVRCSCLPAQTNESLRLRSSVQCCRPSCNSHDFTAVAEVP